MSVFDYLLVAHLLGDFLFQTDKMVENKVRNWPWMAYHVAVYCLLVGGTMAFFVDSIILFATLLALLGASHVIVDRRYIVRLWMSTFGMSAQKVWLAIVIDQVLHVMTLAVVAGALAVRTGTM